MMRKINISLANIQENAYNNSKSFYIIRSLQSERCLYMVESQRGMEVPARPRNQPKATPGLVHATAVGVDVFLSIGLNMHIHNALGKLFS